jgi:hypothetical protein
VISLTENESAAVSIGQDQAVVMSREPVEPGKFVRRIPWRVAIKLFNTGIGLKEGDPDPHWQLVARSDDPHFKPRPAVVTSRRGLDDPDEWLGNNPDTSQWISLANGPPRLPNGVTYTFRTTFELRGMVRGTAVLRGRFIADNHVQSIRLNGRQVPVPEHKYDQTRWFSDEFSARKGFVEGVNTLEIDVLNGGPPEMESDPEKGPMGLLVEVAGSFMGVGREEETKAGAF